MGWLIKEKSHTLDLTKLNLPEDVIFNSGTEIPLYGEITGSNDEIIVITQNGRQVFNAYVGKISEDKTGYEIFVKPGKPRLKVRSLDHIAIHTFDNIRMTMMCTSSAIDVPNWLY